ncbi:MAG TPA: ROK family protein [Rhizomicrobium sp.]|nr:ROK family protein [Rhizomicrobium sp.]
MRIGIDLGGTKIELVALSSGGDVLWRERVPTPKGDYEATVLTIRDLVLRAEAQLGERGSVGVAIPGAISARTGLVKNANSTQLIGHPLDKDLGAAIGRPVRVENDADCFTLSEATDGAGRGARVVFGIIAGTGVGGGIAIDGQTLGGANGIAGEWGHNPLPALTHAEIPGPVCYCGKHGCVETWLSGPALARQYAEATGSTMIATDVAEAAESGDRAAQGVMEKYFDRFARCMAVVVNILDPDVIVIGGGLSKIDALYRELPERSMRYAFTPEGPIRVVKNVHGDSSGVRGAAWLWREDEHAKALG